MNFAVFKDDLRRFFRTSRWCILLLCGAAIVGIAVGCVGGAGVTALVESDDLADYTIQWYIGNRLSFGSFFATGILDVTVCGVLILVCGTTIYLLPVNYLLMILKGYIIGYNAVVIVGFLGVGGFVQIFFLFVPQQLLSIVFLIYCSVCAMNRCLEYRGTGVFCFRGVGYDRVLRCWLKALIFFCAVNLILSALSALICARIVF